MNDAPEIVGLAGAIEALRLELETAWHAGQGQAVRFSATAVTLKLQVSARQEKDGSAKIRWWVVEAGAGAKTGRETSQTLEITLTPRLYDDPVHPRDLVIAGTQPYPGR